jgi:hypothetical protein
VLAGKNRADAGLEVFGRGLKAVDGEQREWLQGEQEKYSRRWAKMLTTDEQKASR